jgi:hypothetical protein
MLPHADSILAHRNAEKANNHKQNANAKLFEGKMHTPGNVKLFEMDFLTYFRKDTRNWF